MSRLEIYIPRILGNVSETTLRDAFERLNIGIINTIDMHRKINENGRVYYFAFLEMKTYKTTASEYLQKLLDTNQPIKMVYDEEAGQYWELHKHIPKTKRVPQKLKKRVGEVTPCLYEAFTDYMHPLLQEPKQDNRRNQEYNMWETGFNLIQQV